MRLDVTVPIEVTNAIGGSEGKGRWVADRVKAQRKAVLDKLCEAHIDFWDSWSDDRGARITILRPHTKKRLDDDNLAGCLKAVRDGVADAIGIDDGDPRLFFRYAQCPARQVGQKLSKVKRRKKGEPKPELPPKRRNVAAYDTHIRIRIEILPASDIDPLLTAVRVLREALNDVEPFYLPRDIDERLATADQLATFDPMEMYR